MDYYMSVCYYISNWKGKTHIERHQILADKIKGNKLRGKKRLQSPPADGAL